MLFSVSIEDLFGSLLACLDLAKEQLFLNQVVVCSMEAISFLPTFKTREIQCPRVTGPQVRHNHHSMFLKWFLISLRITYLEYKTQLDQGEPLSRENSNDAGHIITE